MNICIVLGNMYASGGNRAVIDLGKAMSKTGHDVTLLSLDKKSLDGRHWTDYGPLSVRSLPERLSPDVWMATSFSTWDYIESKSGAKVGYVQGDEPSFFGSGGETYDYAFSCFSQARGIFPVAVSPWIKEMLESRHGYTDIPVIGHSVSKRDFYYNNGSRWFPSNGRTRALVVGQYSKRGNLAKDRDYLAIQSLKGLDVEIFLVSPNESIFSGHVYAHWVNPRTRWLSRIYGSCDFAVVASVSEGSPVIDLELWMCGVPFVRSITPGLGDHMLEDGENCLLSRYGDMELMRSQVEKLLADDGERARLRKNGLEYASRLPTWEELANDWIEIIRSVI